jgi:hypothetical protein
VHKGPDSFAGTKPSPSEDIERVTKENKNLSQQLLQSSSILEAEVEQRTAVEQGNEELRNHLRRTEVLL